MQRKEAEKLLAALIFDDLDETSKTELLNYLQTDNELRERLADMRMAVKVASDTVQHGPDPVLGKRRLKRLASLARQQRPWMTFFTVPRLAAAAAIFIISIVGLSVLLPGLQTASERGIPLAEVLTKSNEAAFAIEQTIDAGMPSESESWRFDQMTSGEVPGRQTGKYAFDPAVRGPEVGDRVKSMMDERYLNVGRRIDSITSVNNEKDFTKNKTGGQPFSILGYADSSPKTGPTDLSGSGSMVTGRTIDDFRSYTDLSIKAGPTNLWDSPSTVAGSTLEGGQSSEMRVGGYYVGGGYGRGGHGAGYGDKNGDGIDAGYYYPGGGFGGMGGYGGGGYGGGGSGGGIMAPSPGGGYAGMGDYAGGGMGGYGGGYSNYGVRGKEFYFHSNGRDSSDSGLKAGNRGDAGRGFTYGDTLFITGGTVDGDKESGSKEINLFNTSPDDTTVVANGGEVVGGSVFFQNGQAVDITIDGSTVKIIDDFEAYNDGAPSPVTVDVGKPVAMTEPELTLPNQHSVGLDADFITSTKAKLTPPMKPTSGVTGISEMPGLKLKTDEGKDSVVWEETKENVLFGDWWRRESHSEDEAFGRKTGKEVNTRRHQLVPEKVQPVKPPVPGFPGSGLVEQGQRQGDVSREADEAEIPYSVEISSKDTEKYIADFLESTGRDEKSVTSSKEDISRFPQPKDEIKALLGTKTRQSADYESSIPAGGPAGKEESKRKTAPILGDIPLIGGLYRTDGKKRPLTDAEEKEIIAHFKQRKLQPKGESAELDYEAIEFKHLDPRQVEDSIQDGLKNLPVTGDQAKVLTWALPKNRQFIVFGSKDQREAVRNMVNAIDIPPGQSGVDRTDIATVTAEDDPDLPPSSRFKLVPVNPWVMAERDYLSTFALDVDTASYALCRRYIRGGFLPPAGAVRMEEFINYFNYHYPQRTNPTFKVHAEAAPSPFARKDQNLTLLKIGVKARTIGRDQRKASNLILVVDASASMGQPDRLPLVQQALYMLVNRLADVDRVSLITCAGEARLHLETVPARERDKIRQAIYAIQPAGPTNLLAGLKLGYATARRSFAPKQINHVVLCSDGVANVGQTEAEAVLDEVAADRKQGITITCVGVGYGSYNDVFLEALANRGDGSYVFLDSPQQAQRVFVRQLAATLQTVAKDARIQVDFNPQRVRRYRLIGYENRDIEDKRFRDDTIDAGEVGSGQCSTALYELELVGQSSADKQGDLGTVFVRYRNVETGQIEEISNRLSSAIVRRRTVESAPRFFLAAGVARFAEILRQSEHARDGNLTDVLRVVEQVSLSLGLDRDVRELADLIRKAEHLPRSP
ncbi:MAG: vWA domain-containing protein [Planctomycetota bacterium]|jgi:Ca-activated chloride channel family protein